MSDDIKRLMLEQEMIRKATESLEAVHASIKNAHLISPDVEIMRALQQEAKMIRSIAFPDEEIIRTWRQEAERVKLLAGVVEDYKQSGLSASGMLRMAQNAAQMHQAMLGPIEDARRIGLLDPESDLRKATQAAIDAYQDQQHLFRLVNSSEVARLAQEAVASSNFSAIMAGENLLGAVKNAMTAMNHPWLEMEHLSRSAEAFAKIQAIGMGVKLQLPFAADLVDAIRPELGDWRDQITFSPEIATDALARSSFYIDRGYNPDLTNFTRPAFDETLELAGLQFIDSEQQNVEDAEQDEEVGYARNRAAFDRLQRFEIEIRKFIDAVMTRAFGPNWIRTQTPGGMADRWRDKKEKAEAPNGEGRPLIEYADFTDYKQIIERKDNWNSVFKPIFGRSEDIRESFQRLFPVRVATMHARIITQDDELFLTVEIKRILRAISRA